MKLASMKVPPRAGRDGQLIVISQDGLRYLSGSPVAPTLQSALDDWEVCKPRLNEISHELNSSPDAGHPLDCEQLLAPLPRAYEWLDASAYLNHVKLVRRARGAALPATLMTDPLVYQGGSGVLLSGRSPIELPNPDWGLDFESELCVALGDVQRGTTAAEANECVRLLMLVNDISLRNLIPSELEKGFGFLNSKPATAFSPFAVTPDELGEAWRDGRVYRDLRSLLNGTVVGEVACGPEMHFSFFDLIAHIAKTRSFTAGTLLGSGTVSNQTPNAGVSCLAELRMRELLEHGAEVTPYLKAGDIVQIEMLGQQSENLFGSIVQKVVSVGK